MDVREYIKNNITLLDGGMGTLLQAAGLKPGEYPERWNISHPQVIVNLQKAYFDAGSNIVCTNTFGANGLKFEKKELEEIIRAAVSNAKLAREQSKGTQEKFIALDIGPCGKLLKPYGDLEFEDAVTLFKEVVNIGVKSEVDLILIETMNDSYETKAALLAAKEASDLPVFVSNAYGEDSKLMTGASPAAMVAMLEGMHADAIGVNCSLGPNALKPVIREYLKYASVPVLMKPNAGLPKIENGVTVFDITPEEFAEEVSSLVDEGLRICGGCCGTTPEYISLLRKKTEGLKPVDTGEKNHTLVSSYTHAVEFCDVPLLIGERINPTGKKRFKQALIENDMDYILTEGISQQDMGVHILDVNVGLPDIDEEDMMRRAVSELQAVINLPLQIDTSNARAMEAGLRIYNGKPLVNSVNGKKESMEAIFPLIQKYGGVAIALTLDENGIPATADGRIEIAKKILNKAKEYGISSKDIVFDPLALTISADGGAALATLESLERIRKELGCYTSLGVSNISFGLPSRDAVNSTFFANALERGLSAAIMNPFSADMLKVYFAHKALHGMDEACETYIDFMTNILPGLCPKEQEKPESAGNAQGGAVSDENDITPLKKAIIKGLKDQAGSVTKGLIGNVDPLDIIQSEIIPALDIVGKGYEEKRVYLPQLLMSAEAAKAAFEVIKSAAGAKKESRNTKSTCVIATVAGDIHDIGKNIVKLLLENYGFNVIDLGKDVPSDDIVEAVIKEHAPICGLSALMTTTVPAMHETIVKLREKAPWCRVVVGGAVLNRDYASSIGSDKYAKDAMETVRYAETVDEEK